MVNLSSAELAEYKKKFTKNVLTAKYRGIGWELTFDQWMELWKDRITQRGSRRGEYNLCRKDDRGPYAVGNCYVATGKHNRQVRGYRESKSHSAAYGNFVDQVQDKKTWFNAPVTDRSEKANRDVISERAAKKIKIPKGRPGWTTHLIRSKKPRDWPEWLRLAYADFVARGLLKPI